MMTSSVRLSMARVDWQRNRPPTHVRVMVAWAKMSA